MEMNEHNNISGSCQGAPAGNEGGAPACGAKLSNTECETYPTDITDAEAVPSDIAVTASKGEGCSADASADAKKCERCSADAELTDEDTAFLDIAFDEAALAEAEDEVPIGACIVHKGKVIAKAHNTREGSKCATHHAEILAIEEACRVLGGWRLPETTLYVTLEPCAMCAGAIINARIPRVVFSAYDLRFGAFGSLIDLSEIPLNHKPEVKRGVMCEKGKEIISAYFKRKRKK